MKILAVIFILLAIDDIRYCIMALYKRVKKHGYQIVMEALFGSKTRLIFNFFWDIVLIIFCVVFLRNY